MTLAWSTVCRRVDLDAEPGARRAWRRAAAVAELDQRRCRVLPQQMSAKAALGIAHPRGQRLQRLEQHQMRRRQQRRLADLAADLEQQPGVQRLPAPGIGAHEATA